MDGRHVGSLPKLMYSPNLWRGEVSSAALKDYSSGYMGGGPREGRAGGVNTSERHQSFS